MQHIIRLCFIFSFCFSMQVSADCSSDGDAERSKNNATAAIEHYTRCIENQESLAHSYTARGELEYFRGNYKAAIKDLSTSLEHDGKSPNSLSMRGFAYSQTNQFEYAESDFKQALTLDPDFVSAYLGRAMLNLNSARREHLDRVLGDINKVIILTPNLKSAYLHRGNYYLLKGDQANSTEADFATFVRVNDHSPRAYIITAQIYKKHERFKLQLKTYEQLIEHNPLVANSHNELAWFLLTCPDITLKDPKRALILAKKSNELAKRQSPNTLDTLALAYATLGDPAKAVELMEQALALPKTQTGLTAILETNLQKFQVQLAALDTTKPS